MKLNLGQDGYVVLILTELDLGQDRYVVLILVELNLGQDRYVVLIHDPLRNSIWDKIDMLS